MLQAAIFTGGKPQVTDFLDDSTPKVKKALKCIVCGKTVFEYFSTVDMIVPGEPPDRTAPLIVQCNGVLNVFKNGQEINTRCKTKYYIL